MKMNTSGLISILSALIILAIPILFLSCSKDDSPSAKSRDLRFEVSGNFSGIITATYVNALGVGANETIASLPWSKNITYAASVPSMAFSVGATGGVAGETIRLKVFAGGSLVSDTPGTANSSGQLVITSPVYFF